MLETFGFPLTFGILYYFVVEACTGWSCTVKRLLDSINAGGQLFVTFMLIRDAYINPLQVLLFVKLITWPLWKPAVMNYTVVKAASKSTTLPSFDLRPFYISITLYVFILICLE